MVLALGSDDVSRGAGSAPCVPKDENLNFEPKKTPDIGKNVDIDLLCVRL